MAEGLAQGVAEGPSGSRAAHRPKWNDSSDALWRNQLMTLHPTSGLSSSAVFGDDAWLSVNMIQAGWKNQAKIKPLEELDFEANGADGIRPTFMGEGAYERDCYTWCGQPALGADLPTTGAWGVRLYAWWGMLAGGVGCKPSSSLCIFFSRSLTSCCRHRRVRIGRDLGVAACQQRPRHRHAVVQGLCPVQLA